jgi:hypothetical protein
MIFSFKDAVRLLDPEDRANIGYAEITISRHCETPRVRVLYFSHEAREYVWTDKHGSVMDAIREAIDAADRYDAVNEFFGQWAYSHIRAAKQDRHSKMADLREDYRRWVEDGGGLATHFGPCGCGNHISNSFDRAWDSARVGSRKGADGHSTK